LPPPAASKVYELTEDGRELARAIVPPLAAWGVRILAADRRKRTEAFRPAWGFLFLRETFDASSARGVHDVYEFHIDDSVISVIVDDGEMQVIEGPSGRPVDIEVHVDATTFIDVGVGRLRGRDAIGQGKLRLVGSEPALRRYASIIRPLAPPRPGSSRLDRHSGSTDNRSRGRRSRPAISDKAVRNTKQRGSARALAAAVLSIQRSRVQVRRARPQRRASHDPRSTRHSGDEDTGGD
jgi:hypothetical protein